MSDYDSGMGSLDDDRGSTRDLTKKILTLGLGAYFLTEDTVRRYVKDAKIPRDIGKTITQNATKGKDELYGFVARELGSFLRQMDLQAELDRFVKSHKIRVNAEIEFLPRESEGSAEGDEEGEGDDGPPIEWNVSVKSPPKEEPPAVEAESLESEDAPEEA
tara:strand:+ start:214 stop:696 length:483 start_codon:yes stop_codon:yes gene_type:complete